MAACAGFKRIVIVSTYKIPPIEKVTLVAPPHWLCTMVGKTTARLLVFILLSFRYRPDFVGGFHLLMNGLAALLAAHFVGARSIYFNGGGNREVMGGGYLAQNPWATFLMGPDKTIERKLVRAMNQFDITIVRGSKTIAYFRELGIKSRLEIIAGGIDGRRFEKVSEKKEFDVILIGRFVQVKRIDLFLEIIRLTALKLPSLKAAIVGTGTLDESLKALAYSLGIHERVTFTGYQSDVVPWLAKSKVFVLTSDSEGLSQALIEAMFCGLPSVVSSVGEHPEIVEHGGNGFLINEQKPELYMEAIIPLLTDMNLWKAKSLAAKMTASKYDLTIAAARWNEICSS